MPHRTVQVHIFCLLRRSNAIESAVECGLIEGQHLLLSSEIPRSLSAERLKMLLVVESHFVCYPPLWKCIQATRTLGRLETSLVRHSGRADDPPRDSHTLEIYIIRPPPSPGKNPRSGKTLIRGRY
ncbi:unnamed protein product [Nesidiocoris tenuis]|uniref:Uncharacterized protein n=1 Tax=Nesidiocoris tenuis TaxID=355587 RepID=A0A6H5GAG7_9HEMI|nr:unnamed protein product [Nesidiocoris tenuis]